MLSDGRFRLTTWRGRDVYWDSEGMLRAATDEQVGIGWPGEIVHYLELSRLGWYGSCSDFSIRG